MSVTEYTEWDEDDPKDAEDADEWNAVPVRDGGTRPTGSTKCASSHINKSGDVYVCTRPDHHAGDHVAHRAKGKIIARWPNDNDVPNHGRYTHVISDTCPICGGPRIAVPGASASVICTNCEGWK